MICRVFGAYAVWARGVAGGAVGTEGPENLGKGLINVEVQRRLEI